VTAHARYGRREGAPDQLLERCLDEVKVVENLMQSSELQASLEEWKVREYVCRVGDVFGFY